MSSHQNNKYNTMKVYDIISEASPAPIIKSLDDILKLAPEKLAKLKPEVLEFWGKKAADADNFKAMEKIADAMGPDKRSWWQKVAPKWLGGKDTPAEVLAAQALRNAAHAGKSADIVKLAATLGLTNEVIKYWTRSGELDQKLQAKSITPEDYKKQLEKLRGEFIIGVMMPWAAMWVLRYPAQLLKIVPGTMSLVGFKNAAEVTRILAKPAAATALIAWFSTDAGKKWVADLFGEAFIGSLGRIPEMTGEIMQVLKAAIQVTAYNTTGVDLGLPPEFKAKKDAEQNGGGSGKYIDVFKGTGREGGL